MMAYRTYVLCWVIGLLSIFALGFIGIKMWTFLIMLGLILAFVGIGMNLLVMRLNGGKMPVNTMYISDTYVTLSPKHCKMLSTTRMPFLADILYVQDENRVALLSIGDLAINVGVGLSMCSAIHVLILVATVVARG